MQGSAQYLLSAVLPLLRLQDSVLRDRRAVRVRLEGIDCPEDGQDFGQRAKQFTSKMAFGQVADVDVRDIDRYGRLVARVYVGGEDVSLAMVRAGLAWQFTRYSSDPELAPAGVQARDARVGLWSHPNPIRPWEFRKPGRLETAAATGPFHGNTRSRLPELRAVFETRLAASGMITGPHRTYFWLLLRQRDFRSAL